MRKNHLRLVVSNKKIKQNLLQKFWHWLNEPHCLELPALPFITTHLEKKMAIQDYLTLKFADYQATTGEVGLFRLCEAMNEVDRLERQGNLSCGYMQSFINFQGCISNN